MPISMPPVRRPLGHIFISKRSGALVGGPPSTQADCRLGAVYDASRPHWRTWAGYRVPHAKLYYAPKSLTAPLPVLIQIAAARPRRSAEEPVEREQVNRRMAAILAADVAGYSRLMGTDEEGTHAR